MKKDMLLARRIRGDRVWGYPIYEDSLLAKSDEVGRGKRHV